MTPDEASGEPKSKVQPKKTWVGAGEYSDGRGSHRRRPQLRDELTRDLKALQLRAQGCNIHDIVRECGYKSEAHAHMAISRLLDTRINVNTDLNRRLDLERIDQLIQSVWSLCMSADPDAQRHIIQLLARRAKLLGLDTDRYQVELTDTTPTKTYIGISPDDWDRHGESQR